MTQHSSLRNTIQGTRVLRVAKVQSAYNIYPETSEKNRCMPVKLIRHQREQNDRKNEFYDMKQMHAVCGLFSGGFNPRETKRQRRGTEMKKMEIRHVCRAVRCKYSLVVFLISCSTFVDGLIPSDVVFIPSTGVAARKMPEIHLSEESEWRQQVLSPWLSPLWLFVASSEKSAPSVNEHSNIIDGTMSLVGNGFEPDVVVRILDANTVKLEKRGVVTLSVSFPSK